MSKSKPCERCIHENVESANYCAHCGWSFTGAAPIKLAIGATKYGISVRNKSRSPVTITSFAVADLFEFLEKSPEHGQRILPLAVAPNEGTFFPSMWFCRSDVGASSLDRADLSSPWPYCLRVNGVEFKGEVAVEFLPGWLKEFRE